MSLQPPTAPTNRRPAGGVAKFSEAGAWRDVGAGWQPIFGSFRGVGYSIEWHDFRAKREIDWAASFHPVWYQCKALELAVTFLVQPEEELFCTRQQQLAQERVEQVMFWLKQDLTDPPTLEELGKKIGCSHFYLSRIFSNHTRQTITQYLRQLRMERAAELLRAGGLNVTEVAMEVGYNSLSHFSAAFHEAFGCCPGLYPLKTPTQRKGKAASPASRPRPEQVLSSLPFLAGGIASANHRQSFANRR